MTYPVYSIVFLTFRNQWGYIFNDDPKVISLVAHILPLCSLFQVYCVLSMAGIGRSDAEEIYADLRWSLQCHCGRIALAWKTIYRCSRKLLGVLHHW